MRPRLKIRRTAGGGRRQAISRLKWVTQRGSAVMLAGVWLVMWPLVAGAQPQQNSSARPLPQAGLISSGHAPALPPGATSPPAGNSNLRPALPVEAWTNSPTASTGPAARAQPPASVSANLAPTHQGHSSVIQAAATMPANAQATDTPSRAAQTSTTKSRTPLAPPTNPTEALRESRGSSGTMQMLLSVGSSLLIVIGLFLGVAWCYRKTVNTSLGGLPKQVVQVLGRTPIATRQQLVLVRFGSKLVLVGLCQGEARTISEITDPLEVDQLAGMCESSQPGSISQSFRSILNQGGAAT